VIQAREGNGDEENMQEAGASVLGKFLRSPRPQQFLFSKPICREPRVTRISDIRVPVCLLESPPPLTRVQEFAVDVSTGSRTHP
jgi:hypothetical protein